jgi:hypothetical protein
MIKERETRCITAHNIKEDDELLGKPSIRWDRNVLLAQISPICQETNDRSERTGKGVLLAFLLQSNACNENCGSILPMRKHNERP